MNWSNVIFPLLSIYVSIGILCFLNDLGYYANMAKTQKDWSKSDWLGIFIIVVLTWPIKLIDWIR